MIELIERLQDSPNAELGHIAVKLIDEYFEDEDDQSDEQTVYADEVLSSSVV